MTAADGPDLKNPPGSIDPAEIERFAAMAAEWWDPDGKFRPLHRLNPVRLGYVRDRLTAHFGRDPQSLRSLSGLDILDVGCGGGLVCEPLARLGAAVTGIDAAAESVSVARLHAEEAGLDIDYRRATVEELVERPERFDAVHCLEVVEHVRNRAAFLNHAVALARPGGLVILSTINRTAKAFAFGIVGAEYVLGWLPRGTHRWNMLVRPSELGRELRAAGARVTDIRGVSYDLLTDGWRLSDDVAVNYMMCTVKD